MWGCANQTGRQGHHQLVAGGTGLQLVVRDVAEHGQRDETRCFSEHPLSSWLLMRQPRL